jgi:hypothetical protein
MRLSKLCALEFAAAVVAAGAAFWWAETILATGPAMALAGLAVALYARHLRAPVVLVTGLAAPVATSVVALVIGALNWGPAEARIPVAMMLSLAAGVIGSMVWRCGRLAQHTRPPGGAPWGRFSVRTALGVTTAACVLLAVVSWLPHSDVAIFWLYAAVTLTLSVGAVAAYLRAARSDHSPPALQISSPS